MALESATYINQLVPFNPVGSDPKGQGDDHIRMIKQVLKNTFPNIAAPVLANEANLNYITDPANFPQRGMIQMFYGVASDIPKGWLLCDGSGNGTPDLRDRFILGAGLSYAPASIGGSVSHTHAVGIAGTALTEAQMPNHRHAVMGSTDPAFQNGASTQVMPPALGRTDFRFAGLATPYKLSTTQPGYFYADIEPRNGAPFISNVGGGAAHTHDASVDSRNHLPPYVALYFIMKA